MHKNSNGVLLLDGTNVKIIGVVKYVGMKLDKFLNISIIQEITMVYLPPLFGLWLSKEFTNSYSMQRKKGEDF